MANNRPQGRRRNVSGQGGGVYRRGDGLGTGPVGNAGGYSGRGGNGGRDSGGDYGAGSGGTRGILSGLFGGGGGSGSGGGINIKMILIVVAIIAVIALIGGGTGIFGKLGNLFSGGLSNLPSLPALTLSNNTDTSYVTQLSSASTSSGWDRSANTGKLDTSVSNAARQKRVKILGGGRDQVTIMVYLCGTDLESKNGMASSDLAEMAKATLSDKLDIIVLTGGCTGWKTAAISNTTNQIYRVANGGIVCLEKDFGNTSMTSHATLTKFIQYCAKNYPANRNELIFWDHGGGSISGYGYDQRFTSSGGMSLSGINTALKNAGVTFDFIGFDTCLMATAENALMLSQYADYLIASEETEPGCGWYYTNWLTKFAANTSMPTVEVGKLIIDDFTDFCASRYQNAKTTLSIVDLAELEATLPSALGTFADTTTAMIKSDGFSEVSGARSSTREYSSNKIDQVDLVHLADNIGGNGSSAVADSVLGAVKYNRTSSAITNSYGLSIYFPYSKVKYVDTAVSTYNAIGMSSEYTRCIKQFASMETAGQVASGGSSSPISSLLGSFTSSSSSAGSSDMISSLLGSFLSGSGRSVKGLDKSNTAFLDELDVNAAAKYINGKVLDPALLRWQNYNGGKVISLTDDQWKLVSKLELNVFYDDGEGYIDLGLDNIFEFTGEGYLKGKYDGGWLTVNGQVVAYYLTDVVSAGGDTVTTGRIPVLLDGQRAEFIVIFDNANPDGKIDAVRYIYTDGETGTVAKDFETGELAEGTKIDFICDYYTYDGVYKDSYKLGDQQTYDGNLVVADKYLPDARRINATFRFTDIYGQEYWSETIG